MLSRVGMLVCLAALSLPSVGNAQSVAAIDREAREHFERGRDAFTVGDYPLAAEQFEQAYFLSGRSALLYNIGTAYERMHRWLDAQRAFQRYVNENPMAPDRPEVESRLRVITGELTRPAPTAAFTGPGPALPPRVGPGPRPMYDVPRPWRTVFWVSAGLGLVAGGVTIGLGVVTNQRYNTLLNSCAPNCLQIDVDDMRQRELFVNLGIATTSVFALGAVLGLIFDQLRPRDIDPAFSHVSIVPTHGGGVLAFEGVL